MKYFVWHTSPNLMEKIAVGIKYVNPMEHAQKKINTQRNINML